MRRGQHPPGRRTESRLPGRPATSSSRAPSPSWRPRATSARSPLSADASLCLARGEALQRRQRHDPDTPVSAYLERCRLKTGKLFEAACALGSRRSARPLRARARDRLPDRGRHPRLRGPHDRDGQGRGHRPARGDADAAAAPRRPRGRGRPGRARRRPVDRRAPSRRRHGRASSGRARWRSTTLGGRARA